MSLEKWVEYGWLRREPTSTGEIKDLLGIVDRSLADSKVEAVSTDLRFIAAFNAALCIATTALRASGLRTVTQAGHHVKTIESLELTIKANPKVTQRFKTFNNKRNKSVYDVAGAVSDQELEAMVKLAEELKNNTLAWLRNLHPELLPAGPSGPMRAAAMPITLTCGNGSQSRNQTAAAANATKAIRTISDHSNGWSCSECSEVVGCFGSGRLASS
ncbi:MAG: hypothetical protein WBW85_06685 [Terriglobales bacterium]